MFEIQNQRIKELDQKLKVYKSPNKLLNKNLLEPIISSSELNISLREDSEVDFRNLNDSGPIPENESMEYIPQRSDLNESSEYCTDQIAE